MREQEIEKLVTDLVLELLDTKKSKDIWLQTAMEQSKQIKDLKLQIEELKKVAEVPYVEGKQDKEVC